MRARYWLLGLLAAALFACGHNGGSNGDGGVTDPDALSGLTDGMVILGDGMFGGSCTAGAAQCADCIDNDMDGKIDGFDPECTGPADNDESSFATGIPGDNIDATYQDCFFDGNSGAGNDGCNQHVCCLLQAGGATTMTNDDIAACMALAPQSNYDKYDRSKCYKPFGSTDVPPKCTMNCGPLAPPGCDCFGCCTICDATSCQNVLINPAVSPNCQQDNVSSPGPDGVLGTADDPCLKCVKSTQCGSPTCNGTDPTSCILCPGQDPSTLPPSCGGGSTCPSGITPCDSAGNCPAQTYCSNGCCIGAIL